MTDQKCVVHSGDPCRSCGHEGVWSLEKRTHPPIKVVEERPGRYVGFCPYCDERCSKYGCKTKQSARAAVYVHFYSCTKKPRTIEKVD